jgi:putative transposase
MVSSRKCWPRRCWLSSRSRHPAEKKASPSARREAVRAKTGISERRACGLVELLRTVPPCRAAGDRDRGPLREAIDSLAELRRSFGYRRIRALFHREGGAVNHKCLQQIYRESGPHVARRTRRHGMAVERRALEVPRAPNEVWPMDFVSDSLENGRRITYPTIVDDYMTEAFDIAVRHGISGEYVTRVLDRVGPIRGLPGVLRTDQGPDLYGNALGPWAYRNRVTLRLIRAGKPTQNA